MSTAQIVVVVILTGLVLAAAVVLGRGSWRRGTRPSTPAVAPESPRPAVAPSPSSRDTAVAAAVEGPNAEVARQATPQASAGEARAAPAMTSRASSTSASPSQVLAEAQSWGYQLQDLDLVAAEASPFDVLVLDPAQDDDDVTPLTPGEVARLKVKPDGGRRLVLASLSVGEAESFRGYWRDEWVRARPDWLLGESADWEGNYAVRFWSPDWQHLLFGSVDACLDQILAQGFDGIYLTGCDVADDLSAHEPEAVASRPDLDRDMARLIVDLATYARGAKPDCLVVMQNAGFLLVKPEVLAVLDGVAAEDLLYGAKVSELRNGPDDVAWTRQYLDIARMAGKAVLVVEYLDDAAKIAQATETAAGLGYLLYVSDTSRELARLTSGSGALRTPPD